MVSVEVLDTYITPCGDEHLSADIPETIPKHADTDEVIDPDTIGIPNVEGREFEHGVIYDAHSGESQPITVVKYARAGSMLRLIIPANTDDNPLI